MSDHKLDKFIATGNLELTEEEKTTFDNLLYFAFSKAFPEQFARKEISMGVYVPENPVEKELLKDQHCVFCKFPIVTFRTPSKSLIECFGVRVFVYKKVGSIAGIPYPGFCYTASIDPIGKSRLYRHKIWFDLRLPGSYEYQSDPRNFEFSAFENFWDKLN